MKKSLLLTIFIMCLVLTACRKEEPLENLEKATEVETKSKFDISEDYANFIEKQETKQEQASTIESVEQEQDDVIAQLETVSNINIQEKLTEEQAQYIDVLLSSGTSKLAIKNVLNAEIFNTLTSEEKKTIILELEQENQLTGSEFVNNEADEELLYESNKKMQEDIKNGELATFN